MNLEHYTILNENIHQLPVVIDLPYRGILVPENIRSRLLDGACLSNTDWFLPELYDFLPAMGCTTIINRLSRYVVDMNRSAESTRIGIIVKPWSIRKILKAVPCTLHRWMKMQLTAG